MSKEQGQRIVWRHLEQNFIATQEWNRLQDDWQVTKWEVVNWWSDKKMEETLIVYKSTLIWSFTQDIPTWSKYDDEKS